ncbi:MAG: flagellar basal body P-ring formation chaperone FlgA [Bdellovibrionales bacterium]|nr:flagellar basal body P-ring formation chaperone FlgA [Bdellovibrionales bacterium]
MKLIGLTILLLTNLVFADSSVSVKSDVVVLKTSKIIYLKDLFAKQELEKFDNKTKKTLATTILAAKVKPGENLEFSSAMISKILRKVNRQKDLKIIIPKTVKLIHENDVFNEKNIKQRLVEVWKQDCKDCEFKFLSIDVPQIKVKSWAVDSYRKLPRGYFTQALKITLDDGSEKIRWTKGKIEIYKKTPVLTRSVAIGERLKESDLTLQLKNITYHYNPIADIKTLIGSKTRRYLSENQIVWLTDVDIMKSVKRGDVITMKKTGGAWQLSTAGIAEQDGVVGDVIRVRSQSNRKLFSAKVVGDREVELQ